MTTKAVTINENTFTKVVSDVSINFLLQNVADTNVNILVRAAGASATVDAELAKAAIQLSPGIAIDRGMVGDGEIWALASTPTAIISVTGG